MNQKEEVLNNVSGAGAMEESSGPADPSRRAALCATCAVGFLGCVGAAVPFVSSFKPSERAKAAGAPVEVDISDIPPGELKSVEWRGKPVWVLHRTPTMLGTLEYTENQVADPQSDRTDYAVTPAYAKNVYRSRKPEYLVVVGICSHLGCSPSPKFESGDADPSLPTDWKGGFLCPCHGSTFDLSGRVYKNKPAPDNLEVPPYQFLSQAHLIIGEDGTS